jgi:hypothetical protein
MGVSSETAEIMYYEQSRWGNYVPVERIVCKTKNCNRGVYVNDICKIHNDMLYYAQLTKERKKKR